jgi:hypothetical protein
MTHAHAERLATLLLGAAVTGAALVVLRTPTLRRSVRQMLRLGLAAAGPWLVAEVRTAWNDSARESRDGTPGPAAPDTESRLAAGAKMTA